MTVLLGEEWALDAACLGIPTEMFFPDSGLNISNSVELKMIVRLCHECPVQAECLQSALDREGDCGRGMRHGVWGGKTPQQRHHIVKGRRKSAVRDDDLCHKGLHRMTPENVYVYQSSEYRECRACRAIRQKRHRVRKAAS